MLRGIRSILAGLAVAAVICAGSAGLAAPHDGPHGEEGPTEWVLKVGKTGEVNIKSDVRIGGSILKRGKYLFQHEVEGEDHVFLFTEITKNRKTETLEPTVMRIKSKQALPGGKTSSSRLLAKEEKDRTYRVMVIEVANEDIMHTF